MRVSKRGSYYSLIIIILLSAGQTTSTNDHDGQQNTFGPHTLRLRQNDRYFSNGVFKCIFLDGNILIKINILLKFVPKGSINNFVSAWSAPSHYLEQWWLVYWGIYASLGLNGLKAALWSHLHIHGYGQTENGTCIILTRTIHIIHQLYIFWLYRGC